MIASKTSSSAGALALAALLPLSLAAAPSPATWTLTPSAATVAPGASFTAQLKLSLAEPWHMYSLTTPKPGPTGGPTATTIRIADDPAIAASEVYFPAPERHFDPNFQLDTETYSKNAIFVVKLTLTRDAKPGFLSITAQPRFQLCTDKECLPPKRVSVSAEIQVDPSAAQTEAAIPAGYSKFGAPPPAAPAPAPRQQPQSLASFLLVAFGFGLAAIFTPCVFPMIPITMSFFLNQQNTRAAAIRQAIIFCLGIVVLFTSIGLGLSAALGPFAVVQLGSNPYVNALITAVFFAFALSLLGAFEITLPSGLLTRLNMASGRGGTLGTLLMGLTFSLASFACVGPFMGSLLAASVGGDRWQPALGMMAFSSAMSMPFFFLALFPSMMQRMPRSGGWMSRVKVVLGFVLLASCLKYLSNVDQVLQWGLLTRERFLALWVVLFALPGLYLLGLLPMEGIRRDEELKPGRLLLGVAFLGFALSLAPGMAGARLGDIEAYIPAPAESASSGGAQWMKNDFDAALARAKAEGKPVLVAFTGYACTNCHWMKANLFPKPEVAAALANFVLVELYTDGTDAASEANQQRQERMFQSVAIPFYAIFDGSGNAVASFPGLTRDAAEFTAFLNQARP